MLITAYPPDFLSQVFHEALTNCRTDAIFATTSMNLPLSQLQVGVRYLLRVTVTCTAQQLSVLTKRFVYVSFVYWTVRHCYQSPGKDA